LLNIAVKKIVIGTTAELLFGELNDEFVAGLLGL